MIEKLMSHSKTQHEDIWKSYSSIYLFSTSAYNWGRSCVLHWRENKVTTYVKEGYGRLSTKEESPILCIGMFSNRRTNLPPYLIRSYMEQILTSKYCLHYCVYHMYTYCFDGEIENLSKATERPYRDMSPEVKVTILLCLNISSMFNISSIN